MGHTERDLLIAQLDALQTLALTEVDGIPSHEIGPSSRPGPVDRPSDSSIPSNHQREKSREDIITDTASKLASNTTLLTHEGPRNQSNQWSKTSKKDTLGINPHAQRPASYNKHQDRKLLGHTSSLSAPPDLTGYHHHEIQRKLRNKIHGDLPSDASSAPRFVLDQRPTEPDLLYQVQQMCTDAKPSCSPFRRICTRFSCRRLGKDSRGLEALLISGIYSPLCSATFLTCVYRWLDDLNAYTEKYSKLDVITRLIRCHECHRRLLEVRLMINTSAPP
jgi:hypothetical protein